MWLSMMLADIYIKFIIFITSYNRTYLIPAHAKQLLPKTLIKVVFQTVEVNTKEEGHDVRPCSVVRLG
jgi:hypothetical protein